MSSILATASESTSSQEDLDQIGDYWKNNYPKFMNYHTITDLGFSTLL